MSYVHPFSKRCDKSEVDLFSVPPTQQSLERGRWIDYAPISSVQNPDSAITFLIAGTDEYIDLSKTILTMTGNIMEKDGTTKLTSGGQSNVAPVNNFSSVRGSVPYQSHARRVFLARRVDAAWKVYAIFSCPPPPGVHELP